MKQADLAVKAMIPMHIQSANTEGASWVLGGRRGLCGYDPVADRIVWRLTNPEQSPMHAQQILRAGEVCVAVYATYDDDDTCTLFGFDGDSGEVHWSRQVCRSVVDSNIDFSSICVVGDTLFFREREKARCVLLDAATGELRTTYPLVDYTWICAHGQRVFLVENTKRLLVLDLTEGTPEAIKPIANLPLVQAVASAERLVLLHNGEADEQLYLSEFDVKSGTLQRTTLLPEESLYWPRLYSGGSVDRWLMFNPDQGLALIDLKAQEQHFYAPGSCYNPMWTPQGILCIDLSKGLAVIDPTDGTRRILDCHIMLENGLHQVSDSIYLAPVNYLTEEAPYPEAEYWSEKVSLLFGPPPGERWPALSRDDVTPQALLDVIAIEPSFHKAQVEAWKAAAAKVQKGGSWNAFFKVTRQLFGLRTLKGPLKRYFEAGLGQASVGASALDGFEKVTSYLYTWPGLFDIGPKDQLVPALIVATESDGVYTFLDLRTGNLARTHHDNLGEFAGDHYELMEENPTKFLDAFFNHYYDANIIDHC